MGDKNSPKRLSLCSKWIFFLLLVMGIALDLSTKAMAFAHPIPIEGVDWLWGKWFGLTHTHNPGAVWGIGGGHTNILVIVRLLVLVGIIGYVLLQAKATKISQVALGIISAGAIGNLYDNLTNQLGGSSWNVISLFKSPGPVRDFIHVDLGFWPCHPWPDFNVADSMILTGVCLLILFSPKSAKAKGGAK